MYVKWMRRHYTATLPFLSNLNGGWWSGYCEGRTSGQNRNVLVTGYGLVEILHDRIGVRPAHVAVTVN